MIKNLTISGLFNRAVSLYSNRNAVSYVDGEPVTYKQLATKVNTLSFALQKRGINKKDKVAIWSENNINWSASFFSIMDIGAVAVPILPDFKEEEVKNIIEHSGAKMLFVSHKLKRHLPEEIIQMLDCIIITDNLSLEEGTNTTTYKDLLSSFLCSPVKKRQNNTSPEDLASIIYTSGTTGRSKGVMLTHRNLVSNQHTARKIQPVDMNDRFLSLLPLSHTFEFTLGLLLPFNNGACIYYIRRLPTAKVLLDAMEKVKPTLVLLVPLIIEKIYKAKIAPKFNKSPFMKALYGFPLSRKLFHRIAAKKLYEAFGGCIKFFGIGGAKLDPKTEQFLSEGGFPYAIGYGLTETSPLSAGFAPYKGKAFTIGTAAPEVKVRINSADNVSGEGEIQVKGENVMKGYYKNEEATKKAFTEDGWFRTGDLGAFDKRGNLQIKGRIKNMILGPSGENIYPEDIEAQINHNELVLESVVYEIKGKIVARIHLNYEELEKKYENIRERAQEMEEVVQQKLEEIRINVNRRVNKFSRLNLVIEQHEPFEKTPTLKIKRYLYTSRNR